MGQRFSFSSLVQFPVEQWKILADSLLQGGKLLIELFQVSIYFYAVSEIISDSPVDFFQAKSRKIIGDAFRWAHEADPHARNLLGLRGRQRLDA